MPEKKKKTSLTFLGRFTVNNWKKFFLEDNNYKTIDLKFLQLIENRNRRSYEAMMTALRDILWTELSKEEGPSQFAKDPYLRNVLRCYLYSRGYLRRRGNKITDIRYSAIVIDSVLVITPEKKKDWILLATLCPQEVLSSETMLNSTAVLFPQNATDSETEQLNKALGVINFWEYKTKVDENKGLYGSTGEKKISPVHASEINLTPIRSASTEDAEVLAGLPTENKTPTLESHIQALIDYPALWSTVFRKPHGFFSTGIINSVLKFIGVDVKWNREELTGADLVAILTHESTQANSRAVQEIFSDPLLLKRLTVEQWAILRHEKPQYLSGNPAKIQQFLQTLDSSAAKELGESVKKLLRNAIYSEKPECLRRDLSKILMSLRRLNLNAPQEIDNFVKQAVEILKPLMSNGDVITELLDNTLRKMSHIHYTTIIINKLKTVCEPLGSNSENKSCLKYLHSVMIRLLIKTMIAGCKTPEELGMLFLDPPKGLLVEDVRREILGDKEKCDYLFKITDCDMLKEITSSKEFIDKFELYKEFQDLPRQTDTDGALCILINENLIPINLPLLEGWVVNYVQDKTLVPKDLITALYQAWVAAGWKGDNQSLLDLLDDPANILRDAKGLANIIGFLQKECLAKTANTPPTCISVQPSPSSPGTNSQASFANRLPHQKQGGGFSNQIRFTNNGCGSATM